ncbi:MAG: DUF3846 domain-containing protein [Pseudomonadota bacterium]
MKLHIRVLVYEPGKPGRVLDVPNTIEALQELVDGFFEVLRDSRSGIQLYVNEEGAPRGLPPNRRFGAHDVVGTAVFTRHDERGDTARLSDDDVQAIRALYG